jgi:rare lipoprotein A
MGRRAGEGHRGRVAQIVRSSTILAVAASGCLALAGCSAARISSSSSSPTYSDKVVADGQPVPKGGGAYHVGQPYTVNGTTYYPAENPSYREEGIASWYGPDFHGRQTANGEIFDMHSITAAHPTMPIPSYARVTNLENGRSIIVRVNDRGPYARGRIIDLSIGAANALNFYGDGLARVRVEYVGRAPLEGTDDRMLLATLRQGEPAPAPSKVMLASTTLPPSFSSPAGGGVWGPDGQTPLPAERPFTLGAASAPVAARSPTSDFASARAPARVTAKPSSGTPPNVAALDPTQPTISGFVSDYGSAHNDHAMGLMSGRGLY